MAIRREEKIYVQVCEQIPQNSDREVGNLKAIRDHYPKYVVTLNEMDKGIENGIKIVHLSEFLLSDSFLIKAEHIFKPLEAMRWWNLVWKDYGICGKIIKTNKNYER